MTILKNHDNINLLVVRGNANNDNKWIEKDICTPERNDVICGRGGSRHLHYGNQLFRGLVKSHQAIYNQSSRAEKTWLSLRILHQWKGRFLNFDKETQTWTSMTKAEARRKISQRLRDDKPKKDRQLSTKIISQHLRDDDKKQKDQHYPAAAEEDEIISLCLTESSSFFADDEDATSVHNTQPYYNINDKKSPSNSNGRNSIKESSTIFVDFSPRSCCWDGQSQRTSSSSSSIVDSYYYHHDKSTLPYESAEDEKDLADFFLECFNKEDLFEWDLFEWDFFD